MSTRLTPDPAHRFGSLRTEYLAGLPPCRAAALRGGLLRIKLNVLGLNAGTRLTSAHDKN